MAPPKKLKSPKSLFVRIEYEQHQILVRRSRREGVSLAEIVRRALAAYVGNATDEPVEH